MKLKAATRRVLGKLFAAGIATEKQVLDLKLEDVLNLPGISVSEISEIMQLQEAIRSRHVISYLYRNTILNQPEDNTAANQPEDNTVLNPSEEKEEPDYGQSDYGN